MKRYMCFAHKILRAYIFKKLLCDRVRTVELEDNVTRVHMLDQIHSIFRLCFCKLHRSRRLCKVQNQYQVRPINDVVTLTKMNTYCNKFQLQVCNLVTTNTIYRFVVARMYVIP